MTGVGGRPELLIQGSMDNKKWKDYDFYYKPGNVTELSGWNIPH